MERSSVYSGAPWESVVAYCRAKRAGAFIAVSGTTAVGPDGAVLAPGDVYAQTREAIAIAARALAELGAGLGDVIRTRTFLTDMSRFDEFARAHREAFAGVDPAATCVEVMRLAAPGLLVEIELDAVAGAG